MATLKRWKWTPNRTSLTFQSKMANMALWRVSPLRLKHSIQGTEMCRWQELRVLCEKPIRTQTCLWMTQGQLPKNSNPPSMRRPVCSKTMRTCVRCYPRKSLPSHWIRALRVIHLRKMTLANGSSFWRPRWMCRRTIVRRQLISQHWAILPTCSQVIPLGLSLVAYNSWNPRLVT